MADIIIQNAFLVTMDPERGCIEKGSLVVEDGRITEVGNSTGAVAEKTIDAAGCIVMPGLVNTHGHLAMTLLRGYADDVPLQQWLENRIWPAESQMTPSAIHIGSLLGCLEMIKSGTTHFSDMYFHMDQTAQAVEQSGLRASLSFGMVDLDDPEKTAAELEAGWEFVTSWNGKADGRISTMYGPHAPNTCSANLLRRVAEQAREAGVGVQIHLLETQKEKQTMIERHGHGAVPFLDDLGLLGPNTLAAHCVWLTDDDIQILADRGVHVSHNAVSNMKLSSGVAPVDKMLSAGINVSLGTDGCASNNNLDMFGEMKLAALLQKVNLMDPAVLPASRVLEMATVNGAAALGAKGGRLKEGCDADIIIIDGKQAHLTPMHNAASQLVYAAGGGDVITSIVNGVVLMENRRVLTLDENAILEEAEKQSHWDVP